MTRPSHTSRLRPENVPLSVESFEAMKAEARQTLGDIHALLSDPQRHATLTNDLNANLIVPEEDEGEDKDAIENQKVKVEHVAQLGLQLPALMECYQGGFEHILFGCSAEDIRGGHAHNLLETRQPHRLQDMQLNITLSMGPVAKSIEAMNSLTPEAKKAAKLLYMEVCDLLYENTQDLMNNAGVRGNARPR